MVVNLTMSNGAKVTNVKKLDVVLNCKVDK